MLKFVSEFFSYSLVDDDEELLKDPGSFMKASYDY